MTKTTSPSSAGRALLSDSSAILLASALNGILGLVFWAIAARSLPVADVGRATTMITAATTIGALSNLSMGPFFERFLGTAGAAGRRTILITHSVVALLAAGLAFGYVMIAPRELFTGTTDTALFVATAVIVGAFALQDSIFVGLLHGRWTAAKNVFHAVTKLLLLIGLATVLTTSSVVLIAWSLPAAVTVAILLAAVAFRWRGLAPLLTGAAATTPALRSLASEAATLYGIVLVNSILPVAIPLLVVHLLGVVDAGYFGVAWTLVAGVTLVLSVVTGPFVARAAATPEQAYSLLKTQARLLIAVAAVGCLTLAVIAPFALYALGADYAHNARWLLVLMGLTQLLSIPGYLFGGLARILRKLRYAFAVQLTVALGVVLLSLHFIDRIGITGVGVAFIIMELVMICLVIRPVISMAALVRNGNAS